MGEMTRGAVYVAYGDNAFCELEKSSRALIRHNDGLPFTIITRIAPDGYTDVQKSRWAKMNLDTLSPYDLTIYIDADTRVNGDITAGFEILENGFDMAIAPSANQGGDLMRHTDADDRQFTVDALNNPLPLALQAGVIFFNRRTCAPLFAVWREEWLEFENQDQGALLRALHRHPVKIALLGRDWNGGNLIEHLFGRARE